jgi:hypothetical protein
MPVVGMTFDRHRQALQPGAGAAHLLHCPPTPWRTVMRSLQHVLWRGAMALCLLLASSAGALTLAHAPSDACAAHALATSAGIDATPHC